LSFQNIQGNKWIQQHYKIKIRNQCFMSI
jgi:hypothetical protein